MDQHRVLPWRLSVQCWVSDVFLFPKMITFLHGKLVEALPTQVVVDVNGIGYEVLIPLSSFDKIPAPGQPAPLEAQAGYAAIDMFVQSAQALQPDFALSAETAPAVVRMRAHGLHHPHPVPLVQPDETGRDERPVGSHHHAIQVGYGEIEEPGRTTCARSGSPFPPLVRTRRRSRRGGGKANASRVSRKRGACGQA